MAPAVFLDTLHARGLTLSVSGDTLWLHGPRSARTDALRTVLRDHKAVLVAHLTARAPRPAEPYAPETRRLDNPQGDFQATTALSLTPPADSLPALGQALDAALAPTLFWIVYRAVRAAHRGLMPDLLPGHLSPAPLTTYLHRDPVTGIWQINHTGTRWPARLLLENVDAYKSARTEGANPNHSATCIVQIALWWHDYKK